MTVAPASLQLFLWNNIFKIKYLQNYHQREKTCNLKPLYLNKYGPCKYRGNVTPSAVASKRIPWRICRSVGLRKSDPAGCGGDSRVWAVSTLVSRRQVDLRPALEEIPPSGARFWGGCQVVKPLSHSMLCSFHCTIFKHFDCCDSKTISESLFPGQLPKKNSIKRQGALEQKQAETLQGSGELFKTRTGWEILIILG